MDNKISVRFGDIATQIMERVSPEIEDSKSFIGLENIWGKHLGIYEWGTDIELKTQAFRVKKGDIIFSRRNTYLKRVSISPIDGICSADAMVIRPIPGKITPEFLAFFMQSEQFMSKVISMSAGSLSSRIKWNDMVNMVFEIPDNENQNKLLKLLRKTYEQEQIIYSAYISALKNLYALGLRCFDNFFDPVKTKRVNLPAGWAPVQISKLLSNPPVSGFSPVESSEDTGRYVLNLNCLSIKGFAQTKPKPIIEENFLKGILVKGGDLLISRSNTQELVGLAGIYTASSYTGNTIFPDTMWRLDVKADLVRKDFLMYYLMSPYGRKSIQRIAAGTSGSMKKINKETLSGLLVPLPSISTQGQIVEAFRLAHSVIQNLEKKKSDLFTLRVAILER